MVRPSLALDPRRFGQRIVPHDADPGRSAARFADDLKLFATTFVGGFLFVTVLIA